MDVDPDALKQAAPGLLGAIGSMYFLSGPWWMRLGMVAPGAVLSYYAASTVAKWTGMNEGLAGFTVGMLGMIFVGKIIAEWQKLELGALLMQWLRKLLRLQDGGP